MLNILFVFILVRSRQPDVVAIARGWDFALPRSRDASSLFRMSGRDGSSSCPQKPKSDASEKRACLAHSGAMQADR